MERVLGEAVEKKSSCRILHTQQWRAWAQMCHGGRQFKSMPWQRNALAPRWKLIYSCTVFFTEVAMSFQIAALYWIKAIKKTTPRPPQRNEHTTAQNTSKQLAHSESKQNVHSIPSYFMRKNPWCFMSTKNYPQSNQQDTVDGPAKSESPVDMVVNIPLFIGFQPSFSWCRISLAHPYYVKSLNIN